ncbi:hypothetical protein [Nonomuraea sp. MG754425]|uniref:hypothetical protein n=1 Tax=Nonomuraea sp. MG754425 TaxID=2570319 RepID=UPI001F4822E2|nr:hypothetical protein [Nonomuraea sp. MG754425]
MTPEHDTPETRRERVYPDETRAQDLAALLDIIGTPDQAMLDLARRRDEEFAARRAHAA